MRLLTFAVCATCLPSTLSANDQTASSSQPSKPSFFQRLFHWGASQSATTATSFGVKTATKKAVTTIVSQGTAKVLGSVAGNATKMLWPTHVANAAEIGGKTYTYTTDYAADRLKQALTAKPTPTPQQKQADNYKRLTEQKTEWHSATKSGNGGPSYTYSSPSQNTGNNINWGSSSTKFNYTSPSPSQNNGSNLNWGSGSAKSVYSSPPPTQNNGSNLNWGSGSAGSTNRYKGKSFIVVWKWLPLRKFE